jgi:hypothetical protein
MLMQKISVVVPLLNEAGNVALLHEEINNVCKKAGYEFVETYFQSKDIIAYFCMISQVLARKYGKINLNKWQGLDSLLSLFSLLFFTNRDSCVSTRNHDPAFNTKPLAGFMRSFVKILCPFLTGNA